MVALGRFLPLRWVAAAVAALVVVGCNLTQSPFPEFIAYTDLSVNLDNRVDDIQGGEPSVDYTLQTITRSNGTADEPRLLLLVEPFDADDSSFDYKGRLLMFDQDLNLLATAAPLSSLDTFGRPFAYGHDGRILVSNSILTAAGVTETTLTFLGLEGPAVQDTTTVPVRTVVFSLSPGEFSGFQIQWNVYDDIGVVNPEDPWSNVGSDSFQIIPVAEQPSDPDDDDGYQILGVVYSNDANDEITFLLSEPSQERVVAARVNLSDIVDGAPPPLTNLVSSSAAFPIEVAADRPLDVHIDPDGFFLRLRDGWMERHNWTSSGTLSYLGRHRIIGDRSFDRNYAFLSGSLVTEQYMYRFDPTSRVLTRYTQWW